MSMSIIEPFAKALIVFGIVLIIGALFALYYNVPTVIGNIHPIREYAYPLGVIGVGAFLAGLVMLKSESEHLKI